MWQVNEGALRRAWESSQRSTREDWAEWMRHFSVELLKESPSPALRTCAGLAQLQPHVARELFAAGFVSCWSELSPVRGLSYAPLRLCKAFFGRLFGSLFVATFVFQTITRVSQISWVLHGGMLAYP